MLAAIFVALATPLGCVPQDPVGVRITMDRSGKGTASVAAMTVPQSEIFATDASEGVTWNRAVNLRVSSGDFTDISTVRIHDLAVETVTTEPSAGSIGVRMPRGIRAVWFRHLHVAGDSRDSIRRSLRDSAPGLDLHENVTVTVQVKGARVTGRLLRPAPRVSVSAKNDVLTVVAPLTVLEEGKDDLVLMVDWERPTE